MSLINTLRHAKFALILLFFVSSGAQAEASLAKLKAFTNQVLELNAEGSKPLYVVLQEKKDSTDLVALLAQGEQSLNFSGLCFSEAGECAVTGSIQKFLEESLARSSGRTTLPKYIRDQFANRPDQTLVFSTKLVGVSSDEITADVEMSFVGVPAGTKNRARLTRAKPFLHKKIEIRDLLKDVSIRKSLGEVSENLRPLRTSVFKIKTASDGQEDLLGASSGHGTGFFLTTGGIAITNHHVINSAGGCLTNLECELKIAQVNEQGEEQAFSVKAKLLTAHKGYDVAVLQMTLPEELKISALEIEDKQIGGDVMTLGFPGDRSEHAGGPLTFSFGELVGLQSQTFSTSAYIMGGASGSPVLNPKSGKVIALLSNGAGEEAEPGEGMPGLARPIDLINQLLGLDDYRNGSKSKRVERMLKSLESSLYPDAAADILSRLREERTYLGVDTLTELLVSHPSVSVRQEIKNYLKRIEFMGFK